MKKNKKRAISTAVGATLIVMLHSGHSSIFSLHMPYMAESLGVAPSEIALSASVSTIAAFLLSLFIAKPLIKKVSPKYALMLASVATVVNVLILFFARGLGLVLFSAAFSGIKQVLGTVMCASLILAEYRGVWKNALPKVTGIVSGATGLGGTIMLFISGRTLPLWGWKVNYLVYGAAIAGLAILLNVLLIRKPVPDEETQAVQAVETPIAVRSAGGGLVLKEALRTPSLYLLMIGIALCSMLYAGTHVYLPTFWTELGVDSIQKSNFAGILTFCSMLAIGISGFLITKFGIRGFAVITFVGAMIGVALQGTFMEIRSVWIVMVGNIFLALGSAESILSSQLVPKIFGTKDFAGINPFVNGAYFLGIGISSFAVGKIAEAAGSFRTANIVSMICGAVGLFCVLLAIKLAPYNDSHKTTTEEKQ